jgi:predicted GIY-YIG superfamily endonuclease
MDRSYDVVSLLKPRSYISGVTSNLYLRVMQHKEGKWQTLFSGFGYRKGPSSMGKISTAGVLRLRATSAVSRDKFVRRSAQDDDFVEF